MVILVLVRWGDAADVRLRLEVGAAPRLLLAGVPAPVPFRLLAAGAELGCDAQEGCLVVEAILSNCHRCGKGVKVKQDVSRQQDCGVTKQTLAEGTGQTPAPGASVSAHYTGRLEDGTKFDSSRDRGEPFTFTLGRGEVIPCWDQGFATMRTGEHAVLSCAAAYAYGDHGTGPIPGGATLIFDVELLSWEGGQVNTGSNQVAVSESTQDDQCVLGSQTVAVTTLTDVEHEVMIMVEQTGVFDVHLQVRRTGNSTVLVSKGFHGVRVIPALLCMTPALVIVLMAVYTKNVVLALMSGLSVGGTLLTGYNPILGFMRAGDTFLYDAVQDADMGLLLFTWFMSGLVGLLSRSGGAAGLGQVFALYATTKVRAQLLTAAAGVMVFFDDYSSILIVGPTMRPMTDACGISRPKLAFLVDTMAAPVASISLVSTWIGFKLSIVQQQLEAMGVREDGLSVLVRATAYSFYPIFAIFFAFVIAATGRDFGPMLQAEREARIQACKRRQRADDTSSGTSVSISTLQSKPAFESPVPVSPDSVPSRSDTARTGDFGGREDGGRTVEVGCDGDDAGKQEKHGRLSDAASNTRTIGQDAADDAAKAAGEECGQDVQDETDALAIAVDPQMLHDRSKPMRAVNAVAPVGVMLLGMVGGIIASGASRYAESHMDGAAAPPPSLVDILSNAETTKVLIWASLTANLVAMALALGQRLLTIEECMEAWIAGMRSVTLGLMTLLFAWGVGNMSQVLHVGPFMAGAVGSALPASLLPTVVTMIAALVSVASGSSWGAMVLLFPTVLPLALVSSDDDSKSRERASQVLVGTIGGVISGSMFGDHVSPISDTTVLTSICTACPIVSLIHCQAWYCILVLAVSILAALLTAVVPESVALLAYPLGFVLLYASLLFLSPPPDAGEEEWGVSSEGGEMSEVRVEDNAGRGGRGGMAKALGRGRAARGTCARGGSTQRWGGRWWAQDGAEERSGLVHFDGGDEESAGDEESVTRSLDVDRARNATGVGAALGNSEPNYLQGAGANSADAVSGAFRQSTRGGPEVNVPKSSACAVAASKEAREETSGLEMAPLGT